MKRFLHRLLSSLSIPKRRGTVRFMFPALAIFGALLGAAAITSTDTSYIRLEVSSATIEAGSRFSLDVYAYAHVPVNAVDVTLQFDEDVVEVLEVDRGQSVLTIWTQDPVIENGTVLLRGGTFKKGFLDEHKIATVDLLAKTTGKGTFLATDVVLLAGDGAGTPVTLAEDSNSAVSFYVYDENATPESIGVAVEIKIITDIDGNGEVTLKDVSAFMVAWSSKGTIYDFNGDGKMTFKDFSIILADLFLN